MISLDERAIRLLGHVAQVREKHLRREPPRHRRQIVAGASAERAGAQSDAVRRAVDGFDDEIEIIGGRDDARQPEQRPRRIVWMDTERDARLLGGRHHFLQKPLQVRAQGRAVDSAIAFEHPPEARHVVAVVGAGQPGHDGREKLFLVALRRGVDPGLGTRQYFGLLLGLGALSLQDETIESGVFVGVEA